MRQTGDTEECSMWDTVKQSQLDALRQREQHGLLTADEQLTLNQLVHELEQDEWATVRPAVGQLQQEQAMLRETYSRLRGQNAALAELVDRYADLLARAQ